MEALFAIAIMIMIAGVIILGFMYMELKRFVDQICKPMKMPQMAYPPMPPPRQTGKDLTGDFDKEPLGFRPPPKKKKEETE